MAGRGSHYCIDFGPFPSPTAASLKEPVEVKGGLRGEFPRNGTFPRADLLSSCPLISPALRSVRKVSPTACSSSGLSFLQLSNLRARRERGTHCIHAACQGKKPMHSMPDEWACSLSLKSD